MINIQDVAEKIILPEWKSAYLNWISDRPVNTSRLYNLGMREFFEIVGKQPNEVLRSDMQQFCIQLRNRGLSENTVRIYVLAVRSFYSFAITECERFIDGKIVPLHQYNPATGRSLRLKTPGFTTANYLSGEKIKSILNAIPKDTLQGSRDYAMFLAYALTGRRNSEIRNLKWGDFEKNRR